MMSKILFILFIVSTVIISTSCNKDSISKKEKADITSSLTGNVIFLKNVLFKENISQKLLPPTYDEKACTTKVDTTWEAGTICFESVGNTCSTPTNCVPVQAAASSGLYTKEEIDHKIDLIEKAYGVKYVY